MANLAEEIIAAVNEDLNNLGGSPPPEVVEEIVVRHAKTGAGDDPVLQQEAAELARNQLKSGMDPDAAAVSAATQTYQKGQSQLPSLEDNGDELLEYRPEASKGIPGESEIDEYLENHDASMTSAQREMLTEATSAMNDAAMSPELAAPAQAAIINATQGGTLMPAGIDIHENLTAVVHDKVTLDLQNSQIKTTMGAVEYNHTAGNFHLTAKDVKLTAEKVAILASETETNIVHNHKRSSRSIYSISLGTTTVTTNPVVDLTLTGIGVDLNLVNASYGTVRVGSALRMDTWGAGRIGFKGVSHETVPNKFMEKFNSRLIKTVIALIILP